MVGLDQIYASVIQRGIWPIELGKKKNLCLSRLSPWEGGISSGHPVYSTSWLPKSLLAVRQPTGSSKVEAL